MSAISVCVASERQAAPTGFGSRAGLRALIRRVYMLGGLCEVRRWGMG